MACPTSPCTSSRSRAVGAAVTEAGQHGRPRVLFSAHGLPEKVVAAGDPYQWQVEQSAAAIVEALVHSGLAGDELDWLVSYQSRVGPLEWIERNVDRSSRLMSAPLFVNPRSGNRYAHKALQRIWVQGLEDAGLPHVPLYEGTKHSFATDAIRRGVPGRLLQKFLGHAHPSSTRRYARLADAGLVKVLRPAFRTDRQVTDKPFERQPEQDQGVRGGPSRTRTWDQPVMSRPL